MRSCEQVLAKEMVLGLGGTYRSLLKKKRRGALLLPAPPVAWHADRGQQLGPWNDAEKGSHMLRWAGQEEKKPGSLSHSKAARPTL